MTLPGELLLDTTGTNLSQNIANKGMILRTLVGSTVLGTSIAGQDDRDEMGICVEPPRCLLGLDDFKHYTWRTKPEGVCSGPGDVDLVVYGLRRFASLAAKGNPTVLTPLFVPEEHVLYSTWEGKKLRQEAHIFWSRQAGKRFRGYLESQRKGLLGMRSGGSRNQGRADIREKYGFDTKFAMHMVRLGLQGVEFMEHQNITLPIQEPELTWLRDLRQGKHTLQEALDRAVELEAKLDEYIKDGDIPEYVNRRDVNNLLQGIYMDYWDERGWI